MDPGNRPPVWAGELLGEHWLAGEPGVIQFSACVGKPQTLTVDLQELRLWDEDALAGVIDGSDHVPAVTRIRLHLRDLAPLQVVAAAKVHAGLYPRFA